MAERMWLARFSEAMIIELPTCLEVWRFAHPSPIQQIAAYLFLSYLISSPKRCQRPLSINALSFILIGLALGNHLLSHSGSHPLSGDLAKFSFLQLFSAWFTDSLEGWFILTMIHFKDGETPNPRSDGTKNKKKKICTLPGLLFSGEGAPINISVPLVGVVQSFCPMSHTCLLTVSPLPALLINTPEGTHRPWKQPFVPRFDFSNKEIYRSSFNSSDYRAMFKGNKIIFRLIHSYLDVTICG